MMNRERWFRRDEEALAFDWRAPARALAVDTEVARRTYERALHTALGDAARAETLYLRQLQAIAEGQRSVAPEQVPGRLTRLMVEAMPGKYCSPEQLGARPFKFSRVEIEATRAEQLPGYDAWKASMAAGEQRVQRPGAVTEAGRAGAPEPVGPLTLLDGLLGQGSLELGVRAPHAFCPRRSGRACRHQAPAGCAASASS